MCMVASAIIRHPTTYSLHQSTTPSSNSAACRSELTTALTIQGTSPLPAHPGPRQIRQGRPRTAGAQMRSHFVIYTKLTPIPILPDSSSNTRPHKTRQERASCSLPASLPTLRCIGTWHQLEARITMHLVHLGSLACALYHAPTGRRACTRQWLVSRVMHLDL